MIVIDVGNTNTVLGIYKNNKIINKQRVETRNLEILKLNIRKYFTKNNKKINKSKICIVASVVPKLNTLIKKIVLKNNYKYFNLTALNIPFRIKIKYDLNKIGADRIANTVAVINYKYKNCIIIDFGTATTFDVIKNNTYEGGVIFPGIKISLDSLVKNAALLKKTKIFKISKIVTNNTKQSIQSGFYWGYLSLINGIIQKIIKEKKIKPKIIMTGGLAKIFKDQIILKPILNENLTLEGLGIIGKAINE